MVLKEIEANFKVFRLGYDVKSNIFLLYSALSDKLKIKRNIVTRLWYGIEIYA